ncbi:MAG: AcrR family transcriptional regulator [Cellvibrionaceae bacterium]|jgi:AcrR family transcriptional regulator
MLVEKKLTNQERIDQSDKSMLACAVELILEKGTEKTTLKEVGEKAGYSRGLAGYRFGSKSSLFAFVLTKLHHYWLYYLKEATAGTVGLAAITSCTDIHFQVLDKNYDNVRAFYILWFEALGDDADLKKIVININAERHESVKHWIINDASLAKNHKDAFMLATQYNCMINGIVYQYLLASDSAQINSEELKNLHNSLNKTMSLLLR